MDTNNEITTKQYGKIRAGLIDRGSFRGHEVFKLLTKQQAYLVIQAFETHKEYLKEVVKSSA